MTKIPKTIKINAFLFCAVFLFLGLAGQAFAATYYVAKTGSDSADGSQGSPWLTIQHAVNIADAGDTVNVLSGTYYEKVNFTKSGTAGNPITFQSSPEGAAIIDGTGLTFVSWEGLVTITGASYITISGFEIRNSGWYNILLKGDATHTRLLNLDVHNDLGEDQIDINGPITKPAFSVISGCKVHDGPGGGINLWQGGGGYWLVENNEVYNNAGAGNYDGIQVEGGGNMHHIIIKNNLIHDNASSDNGEGGADNLDLTSGRLTHHYLVEGNDIYGSEGSFKLHSGAKYTPGVSSFHIARFNRLTGLEYVCYGFPNPIVLYNNTFVDAGQFVHFSGDGGSKVNTMGDSTYTGGDTGRMNFKNNIFFQEKPSYAYALIVEPDGWNVNVTYASVRMQHSLYRMTNNQWGWGTVFDLYEPMTPEFFADFQASGAPDYPDTGSILTTTDASQNFVGYATKDYHLTSTSPAIDAGMALTTATSSGTNSTTLVVDRASYFFDGYCVNGECLDTPDSIVVGSNLTPVQIVSITDSTNTITLASPRTWSSGDPVTLAYSGSAPDIGAFEYDSGYVYTPPACTPSWSCGSWTTCASSYQT
ncbi:MAG: right-handed parallel beta-helix repeat-containing protein, partial [Candidatus Staskawiczbacteria bacterium]|nr:right-handed parallel beta-helix repeat-containing protein [Candidatus Staskawiczbacteria bacterium]